MMSKERDLLGTALDFLDPRRWLDPADQHILNILSRDIEELLAQPEQEPVGIVITIGGYPDDSEHTVKLTCRHRDLKDGDLLYTSPPKREPLSDEDVLKIAIKIAGDIGMEHDTTDFEGTGIFELARAIEKAHGIGGGE